VKIDSVNAAMTREQIGSHAAGWFQAQPYFSLIMHEQRDLLE